MTTPLHDLMALNANQRKRIRDLEAKFAEALVQRDFDRNRAETYRAEREASRDEVDVLRAKLDQARDAALEEAAQVADNHLDRRPLGERTGLEVGDAIRALKNKAPSVGAGA